MTTLRVICEDGVEREFTPAESPGLRTRGSVTVDGVPVMGAASMAHDGRLKFWADDYHAWSELVARLGVRTAWPKNWGGAQ